MARGQASQKARSESHDSLGNSDDEASSMNGTSGSGRKGSMSGSSKDVDQRKEQNRIAQREFRQRKQQYIKGLEARLQLHESSRDEQLDQMRTSVRALIEENQRLRELLASVSGFIGEGIGGVLPKIGVDLPEFNELISRSKTEHVLNTLEALRDQKASAPNSANKRPRLDDPSPSSELHSPVASTSRATYALPPAPPPPTTSDMSYNYAQSYAPPPTMMNYGMHDQRGSMQHGGVMIDGHGGLQADGLPDTVVAALREAEEKDKQVMDAIKEDINGDGGMIVDPRDLIQNMFSRPTDNPKLQAIQLISYHMKNKRLNPDYHLPPSLRPTVTQQSVPHSPFFDGIIFASLRDRLILLKDQYHLPTLLTDLVEAMEIHEDDILVAANYELSETFLRKYWYVIDTEVLAISNRWRKERGEDELSMRDIIPDGADIPGEGLLGKKFMEP